MNDKVRAQLRPILMLALSALVATGVVPEEFVRENADNIVATVLAVWAIVAGARNEAERRRAPPPDVPDLPPREES